MTGEKVGVVANLPILLGRNGLEGDLAQKVGPVEPVELEDLDLEAHKELPPTVCVEHPSQPLCERWGFPKFGGTFLGSSV